MIHFQNSFSFPIFLPNLPILLRKDGRTECGRPFVATGRQIDAASSAWRYKLDMLLRTQETTTTRFFFFGRSSSVVGRGCCFWSMSTQQQNMQTFIAAGSRAHRMTVRSKLSKYFVLYDERPSTDLTVPASRAILVNIFHLFRLFFGKSKAGDGRWPMARWFLY